MAWLNIDDNYAEHPKHDALSDGAFRLLTAALCHCAKQETDGFVDAEKIPRLMPRFRRAYLDELLHSHPERPDLVVVPGGYRVRDYLEWNHSRAEVEAARALNAKRQAKWREGHRDSKGRFQR